MNAERLLVRLARADFVLAREADGARYGAYVGGDRRRRPVTRIPAAIVMKLIADGALCDVDGERVVLSAAGRARGERAAAPQDEAWRAQHDELVDRPAMDRDGDVYTVRGTTPGGAITRLARMKDAAGNAFFAAEEIAAGARLAQDWAAGQQGLVRGADWTAPPRGSTPRGSAAEAARGAVIDARARVDAALRVLAPNAAALIKAACLEQHGLEIIESRARWPARSGKVALKFALAQLALAYRATGLRGGPARQSP